MKMNLITNTLLAEVLGEFPGPCVSLYLPTHRHGPENQQDLIGYRNLLKEAEALLLEVLPKSNTSSLLSPFENLVDDVEFWHQTLEGLAVFGAPGFFRTIGLQRTVMPLAIVAESFHTKPLRRFLQSTDRYQVLALSLNHVRLFEGDRDALDEVDLAQSVQITADAALHTSTSEPEWNPGQGTPKRHELGLRNDAQDVDASHFFREIDKIVIAQHSHPSGLPLILAALPENQALFHQISHNPLLLKEGIKIDPTAISREQLRERAWKIMEPEHQNRLAGLADDYETSKAKGTGLEDLKEVAAAAFSGRVATLLVEEERKISGHIHPGSGHLHFENSDKTQGDDLLDDLGEMVLKRGGRVFVLPTARMPTETGAAANCRY